MAYQENRFGAVALTLTRQSLPILFITSRFYFLLVYILCFFFFSSFVYLLNNSFYFCVMLSLSCCFGLCTVPYIVYCIV